MPNQNPQAERARAAMPSKSTVFEKALLERLDQMIDELYGLRIILNKGTHNLPQIVDAATSSDK